MRSHVLRLALVLWLLVLGAAPVVADGGRTVALIGQDYTLHEGQEVDNDLAIWGGRVHLERGSLVRGDVAILGGEALVEGEVAGDVVAVGGTVELAATAVIQGDLVVFGTVRRHPEARINGNVVQGMDVMGSLDHLAFIWQGQRRAASPRPTPQAAPWDMLSRVLRRVMVWSALLVLAILLRFLAPHHVARLGQAMSHRMVISLALGALTLGLLVLLLPLLVLLCVGIPFAVVLIAATLACALAGWVALGELLGRRVFQGLGLRGSSPLVETLLGAALIGLAANIPCLGTLVILSLAAWSLGAAVLTRLGTVTYGAGTPLDMLPARPNVSASTPAAAGAASPGASRPPQRKDTRPLGPEDLGDEDAPPPSGS
jgi:hypothetical protein